MFSISLVVFWKVIATSLETELQASEIVHSSMLLPILNPLTKVFGSFISLKTAFPEITSHVPVSLLWVELAFNVVKSSHISWFAPALEDGILSIYIIDIGSEYSPHNEEYTFHWNIFSPSLRLLTAVLAELGLVKKPVPATIVQVPVSLSWREVALSVVQIWICLDQNWSSSSIYV